jgi:hypothetical protein
MKKRAAQTFRMTYNFPLMAGKFSSITGALLLMTKFFQLALEILFRMAKSFLSITEGFLPYYENSFLYGKKIFLDNEKG